VKSALLQEKLRPVLINRAVVAEEEVYEQVKKDPAHKIGELEYDLNMLFIPDKVGYDKFTDLLKQSDFFKAAGELGLSPVKMGYITKNFLLPEIASRLDNIPKGSVSAPVIDSEGRYLVMMVADIRNKTTVSDEALNSVEEGIRSERISTIFKNWLIKSRQTIVIHKEV
jgi:parvulin-like peptidyl-prolyl isomerase